MIARLPQVGSDDGSWGEILNDFLSQAHNADGTLKQLSQSQIAGLVADLAAKVQSSDLSAVAFSGSYNDLADKPSVGDASASGKGLVQLAGDLDGTAAAPTVVDGTHHSHSASQISDSTATGRSLLTAADADSARTAIGAGTVNGTGVTNIVQITQSDYTALATKDSNTLYVLVG